MKERYKIYFVNLLMNFSMAFWSIILLVTELLGIFFNLTPELYLFYEIKIHSPMAQLAVRCAEWIDELMTKAKN